MENKSLKKMIIDGLMIAIVFLATYFTKIPSPIPQSYVNLGDAVIIVAALLFGKRNALIAGAIGSALTDLAVGSFIYAPVTFVVKGLEGLVMGILAEKLGNKTLSRIITILIGMFIMVFGYFISEATFLGMIDDTLGWAAAVVDLPLNIFQGIACAVAGYALSYILSKNKAINYN